MTRVVLIKRKINMFTTASKGIVIPFYETVEAKGSVPEAADWITENHPDTKEGEFILEEK